MDLAHSLRLDQTFRQVISFVGAGGKTTAMFQLARSFPRVIVTATTHLGVWQIPSADQHIIATDEADFKRMPTSGITLITGEIEYDRTSPLDPDLLLWLREFSTDQKIPLMIEADGSRQKPLKAPAGHEPAIPTFSDLVVVLAGLSAIGKPLRSEHIQRPEIYSQLSGLPIGDPVTSESITCVLTHAQGGLKNIPPIARRVALLNQAELPELRSIGGGMAHKLLDHFESVVVGSLQPLNLQTFERCAGIILAAGESTRFGSPKQLLDWKGKSFVRRVAETALQAGLWPVVVVTGSHAAEIESTLHGLPVNISHNPEYKQGQSTSIRTGIQALPLNTGSAVFLLADQPQIPAEVVRALIESHAREMQPILAPMILEERRANPVLFDRVAFQDLLQLTGDTGGRAIFHKHRVDYLPWHDDILLFDVDQPEDYQRLQEME